MSYAKQVGPYLNTNPELDGAVFKLWELGRDVAPSIDATNSAFMQAVTLSPNIIEPANFVPHCFEVAKQSSRLAKIIGENFPRLAPYLNPDFLYYAGLIEDSMYFVGGNGKNNSNGLDSKPVHEILTYFQMKHMGLTSLARGTAMHFVAPQILKLEKREGRFNDVDFEDKPHPTLDILTAVDALCTNYWLPVGFKGSLQKGLDFRIKDIVQRRGEAHPIVRGLESGGRERLGRIVNRVDRLMRKEIGPSEVEEIYQIFTI